MATFTSSA